MRTFIVTLGVIFCFPLTSKAHAATYDWVNLNSEDLEMIADPKIEAAFRLELVQRAQSNIDIVTYDQRADNIAGMPLLKAVRSAAERGVHVRFLTSFSARAMKDPWNAVGRYLWNAPRGTPIEFFIVGGPSMKSHGWNTFHGIHEKLFIIDHKWTLITGRGHGEEYLHWIDTAFTIKNPDLVAQTVTAYEALWNTLILEKFIEPDGSGSTLYSGTTEANRETSDFSSWMKPLALSEDQQEEVNRLTQWIDQPVLPLGISRDTSGDQEIFSARLLHFDLLAQLRSIADAQNRQPNDISDTERVRFLNDPIMNAFIDLSTDPDTHDLSYYTLAVTPTDPMKEALLNAVQRGVDIKIFTNSKKSHTSITPFPWIPFGWYLGLKDMTNFLQNGIHIYDYAQNDPDAPNFVHRKLAVSGNTVIFGSHNLDFASAVESDEMSIQVRGASFAQKVRQLSDFNTDQHSTQLQFDKILSEHNSSHVNEWISAPFRQFY